MSFDRGKSLSYECLVKNCKSCEICKSRKSTVEYDDFMNEHECPINHIGSAGAMEASGVLKIYEKSVENVKLFYIISVKAYPTVGKAQPCGPN